MDFKNLLGNVTKSFNEGNDQPEKKPDDLPEKKPDDQADKKPHSTPSNSELLASAKVVAEAAKSGFSNESNKFDKAKLAEASADLLDGAEAYGKLDQKGAGSYLDKAEEYLHNYGSSPTKPAGTGEPAPEKHPSEEKTSGNKEKSEGGGGYGQYIKTAEGLFK